MLVDNTFPHFSRTITLLFVLSAIVGGFPIWGEGSITKTFARGFHCEGVGLQSRDLATVEDLRRAMGSPFVSWTETQGNRSRFRTWLGSSGEKAPAIEGSKAYLFYCSQNRTITVTGGFWSAAMLRIPRARGFQLVANHRPPSVRSIMFDGFQSIGDFQRETGLLGMVQLGMDQHIIVQSASENARWIPILKDARDSLGWPIIQTFEPSRGYGLIDHRGAETMILPNTNRAPRAVIQSVPMAITTGTTLSLDIGSTDNDDEPHNLTHTWEVRSSDRAIIVTGIGTSFDVPMQGGDRNITVSLVTSDGLAETRDEGSGALLNPVFGIEEVDHNVWGHKRETYGDKWLRVFGIEGKFPALSSFFMSEATFNVNLANIVGYRFQFRRMTGELRRLADGSEVIDGWRTIDTSAIIPYLGTKYPKGLLSIISLSMDAGEATTDDDTDMLIELAIRGTTPTTSTHFFAYSKRVVQRVSGSVRGRVRRVWNSWLGAEARRIAPVSLANRFINRVGYEIQRVHSNTPIRKKRAILFHEYDVRSEFCGIGQTFLEAEHRWDEFLGTTPTSSNGVAQNISDLEQYYTFDRAIYSTTRSIPESARALRDVAGKTVFSQDADPELVLIGYSMGGLIARAFQNEIVGGKRIGERVRWLITIGSPHHGSTMAGGLLRGVVQNKLQGDLMNRYGVIARAPFWDLGCVPPSRGLTSLQEDATLWQDRDTRGADNMNPWLTQFNERDDAFRNATNVITIGGGTYELALRNSLLEYARLELKYWRSTRVGFSDGAVETQSSLPTDLFGFSSEAQGNDPFFGRRPDGTMDRRSYRDGLDHFQLKKDPAIIAGIHSFLSYVAIGNHAPVDTTPYAYQVFAQVSSARVTKPTTAIVIRGTAQDEDGDTLSHHWTIARVLPEVPVELLNKDSATPTITTSRSTNVLLWHVVRDGRGGIAIKLINCYIAPMFRDNYDCDPPPDYRLIINATAGANQQAAWKSNYYGCSVDRSYLTERIWLDPTDDSTLITNELFQKCHYAPVYGYLERYPMPDYGSYPIFSNIAMATTTVVPRIPDE